MKMQHVLAGWCVGLTLTGAMQAATITWGTVQDTSSDSNVVATGATVLAENVGHNSANPGGLPDTVTVNGVTFTGSDVGYGIHSHVTGQTTPYATLSSPTSSSWSRYGLFGGSSGPSSPWNSFSADYKKLLSQGLYFGSAPGRISTLKFWNLTVGQTYEFEYWACDGRYNMTDVITRLTDPTNSANYVELNAHGSASNKMPGQFVTGMFTADATTQSVVISAGSTGAAMFNGYQLRAIPEPASLTLLGLGGVMMGSRRLRDAESKR